MLAFLPACLVTDKPELSEPTYTRPQLIDKLPRTTELIRWSPDQGPLAFSVDILSEDAGVNLSGVMLLDYGIPNAGEDPWQGFDVLSDIDAGSLADGPRNVDFSYTPQPTTFGFGCHTLTLLVTHQQRRETPGFYCARDPQDAATLTWFMVWCEISDDPASCDFSQCPFDDRGPYVYCPGDTEGLGAMP